MQFSHVRQFCYCHLEKERIRFYTIPKTSVDHVKIHGVAHVIHKNCLSFLFPHLLLRFRIRMKETFFCHLLTVGAILVFLYGMYKNSKFLTFLSLNIEHFPSVLK